MARDKVVKYFVDKSKDKKAGGKLGVGKGANETLDEILGKDWKSASKSFPSATTKTQAQFDTATKVLTDKIDKRAEA